MKTKISKNMSAAHYHVDALYDKMKEIIDKMRNHGNIDEAKLDEAYAERQIIQKLLFDVEDALKAMP